MLENFQKWRSPLLDLLGSIEVPMRPKSKLTFSDFWAAYPRRRGSNPKAPAEKKFCAAVSSGIDPERIINSAKAYADELRDLQQLGSQFVAQAQTWLNQKRWDDYAPDPGSAERDARVAADMKKRGWCWTGQKWEKISAAPLNSKV